MVNQTLKIGIIGAGSIGGTLATFLCLAGYDVEITQQREESIIISNRINIEVTGALGDHSCLVPFAHGNDFSSKKDILFVCTKAFSVANTLKDSLKYLKPNGIVLSLQNVLHLNEIAKSMNVKKYIPLILDWSSRRQNGQIIVLSKGNIHIGALNNETLKYLPLLKKILSSVAPVKIEKNMYTFMLSRFILHCNQCCLGALTGYNLGKNLKEKQGKKIFINLIKEQLNLFNHLNIEIPPYNNVLDYYKFVENSIGGVIYRSSMFKRLINQNENCLSPILWQLENKKRTELDYMCNYFVQLGESNGIEMPYNKVVSEILYEVERGERSIFMENLFDERFLNL